MQIALDTVVYIILSLMLFSLVLAFLPRVEDLGNAFAREKIKVDKEKVVEEIIQVYLGKKDSSTLFLREDLSREELLTLLDGASLTENITINFNTTKTISIIKEGEEVIING